MNITTNDYTAMTRLSIAVHKQIKLMAENNGTTMSKVVESLLENSGNTAILRVVEAELKAKIASSEADVAIAKLALEF